MIVLSCLLKKSNILLQIIGMNVIVKINKDDDDYTKKQNLLESFVTLKIPHM